MRHSHRFAGCPRTFAETASGPRAPDPGGSRRQHHRPEFRIARDNVSERANTRLTGEFGLKPRRKLHAPHRGWQKELDPHRQRTGRTKDRGHPLSGGKLPPDDNPGARLPRRSAAGSQQPVHPARSRSHTRSMVRTTKSDCLITQTHPSTVCLLARLLRSRITQLGIAAFAVFLITISRNNDSVGNIPNRESVFLRHYTPQSVVATLRY